MSYPRILLLPVLAFVTFASTLAAEPEAIPQSPRDLAPASLGRMRSLAPDMLGFNGNMTSMPGGWSDARLVDAFRRSHAGLFRYPAGTLANTWDWDRGWLDSGVPTEDLINWVREFDRSPNSPHRYPLEEVAKLHRALGTSVVFVLNMLSKDLEHSLRGLRRARDLGLPVKYVEMGNELFFNLPLESRVFPTPEDYGRICSEWITAIKREFPGVKCALVAGGRAGNPRSEKWTERALAHCPNADAIVVHTYMPSGLMGRERRNTTAGTEGTTTGEPAMSPGERQTREMNLLRTPEGFARMMNTAYSASQRPKAYFKRPGMEIWITEWNLRADNDAVRGTWANTLFILTAYHGLLGNSDIRLSHYHNVIGDLFAAIHTREDELRHVVGLNRKTTTFSLSAGGLATALLGDVATGRTQAAELVFADAPRLVAGDAQIPGVWGWIFSNPGGMSALVVNLTPEVIRIPSPAGFAPGAQVVSRAASVDTYVAADDSIPNKSSSLGTVIELPPYSVTSIKP